jgi:hypothetical protein
MSRKKGEDPLECGEFVKLASPRLYGVASVFSRWIE